MEGELKRFYFHCSDGLDLVLDREGIEADGSEVLWWALKAADRLMSALLTYDGWSAWTVAVHDQRGCLVDTVPFPKNVDASDALCPEERIDLWPQRSPPTLHPTVSTRYH
jgi:hypothetical protein